MPRTITDDEGNDIEVFTPEEVEAQQAAKVAEIEAAKQAEIERLEAEKAEIEKALAEKDEHVKQKLDEFISGKKSVEQKEKTLEEQQAELAARLKEIEEKSAADLAAERNARFNSLKNFMFQQYGAQDEEIKQKLEESYDLINVDVTDEAALQRRVEAAARLAGVGSPGQKPTLYPGVGGGAAPDFSDAAKKTDEAADLDMFQKSLGLKKYLPDNNQ